MSVLTATDRNRGIAALDWRAATDALSILLVWSLSVTFTLFIEPNHGGISAGERVYYSTYNAAVGSFVGLYLFGRRSTLGLWLFASVSVFALCLGTLINESLVEPYVFRGGAINGEGIYYGLVESARIAGVFILIRLAGTLASGAPGRTAGRVSNGDSTSADADLFFVRVPGGTRRIFASDVIYMKAEKDFTRIVCSAGEHFVSESLKSLVEKSASFGVIRVHKSFAVNIHRVERMNSTEARLGDSRVPVGRVYREAFADAWKRV